MELAKYYICRKLVSLSGIKKKKYYMKSALVSLHGWKNEEYSYFGALVLLYGFMAYLFLKNGSRKTNEIEKKCRIETIGQE